MTTAQTVPTMDDPTTGDWAWTAQPEARRLVEESLIAFVGKCPEGARFGERLLKETGTHITDWVGVILTPDTPETRARLEAAGYVPRTTEFVDADIHYAFWHPGASTPDILLTESDRMSVGLLVDSVADFFAANQLAGVDHIQGEPLARARWAQVAQGEGAALWVFERHGYDGFHLKFEIAEHRIAAMHHLERFRARHRGGDQARAFDEIEQAARAASDELGADWAASLFMRAEREYFVRHHDGAFGQATRQGVVGLGLANVDHAVYASCGSGLARTLEVFAVLGFRRRESFDVGQGDLATVLEQPVTGDTVVVVSPSGDAAGGSGSWARLIGESLAAGGPAGMALRGEADTLGAHLGFGAKEGHNAASVHGIAVSQDQADMLAAEGLVEQTVADAIRSGAAIGPVLSLVSRCEGSRSLTAESIAWRVPG